MVDVAEKADFPALLGILGSLSYPQLDVRRIIGREHMRASKFYQEIQEEGAIEVSREYILAVLGERFKGIPLLDIAAVIAALEDLPKLKSLALAAATCETLDSFRAALPGQTAHA